MFLKLIFLGNVWPLHYVSQWSTVVQDKMKEEEVIYLRGPGWTWAELEQREGGVETLLIP